MDAICRPATFWSVFSFLPYMRKNLCSDCFKSCSDFVLRALQIFFPRYNPRQLISHFVCLNLRESKDRFTHSLPCPCRAAKGLECVFPIWFTQCGRVWFTLAMPCPCRALTMLFFSRPRHSTAVERRPVGYLPAFGFFRLPRGVPRRLLSEAYQSSSQRSIPTTVKTGSSTLQKDDLSNCWTSSSDISGYHSEFHEGHDTVGAVQGARHGHGMLCVNRPHVF
jgi:hypothetical protein